MENARHFGSLTPRMQAFREEVLDEKPFVDAERAVLCTESYRQTSSQPPVLRRALSFAHILDNMSVYIEDKTLLAGNQATKNCNAPVFPEYTLGFVLDELDEFDKRDGDVFHVTDEDKARIRSIAPFWEGNTLRERGLALLPDEVAVFMETGVLGMEGKLNAGDAHLAINHARLLREGLRGYEERARSAMDALDLTDPESIDKLAFYRAVLTVIPAVRRWARRYAGLARELAAKEQSPSRIRELELMARTCERVPFEPARSFREAVQAVWFSQVLLQIESNGHSLSYGRLDQYLLPYYQADVEGEIGRASCRERV